MSTSNTCSAPLWKPPKKPCPKYQKGFLQASQSKSRFDHAGQPLIRETPNAACLQPSQKWGPQFASVRWANHNRLSRPTPLAVQDWTSSLGQNLSEGRNKPHKSSNRSLGSIPKRNGRTYILGKSSLNSKGISYSRRHWQWLHRWNYYLNDRKRPTYIPSENKNCSATPSLLGPQDPINRKRGSRLWKHWDQGHLLESKYLFRAANGEG